MTFGARPDSREVPWLLELVPWLCGASSARMSDDDEPDGCSEHARSVPPGPHPGRRLSHSGPIHNKTQAVAAAARRLEIETYSVFIYIFYIYEHVAAAEAHLVRVWHGARAATSRRDT